MTKDELKKKISPEFLELLVECAAYLGWEVDFNEMYNFIERLYNLKGLKMPKYQLKLLERVNSNED